MVQGRDSGTAKKRSWGWPLAAVMGMAIIAVILDPPPEKPVPAPGQPALPDPGKVEDLAKAMRLVVPGGSIYTFALPSGSSPQLIEAAAKKRCEGADFCQVRGWTDPAQVPSAWPMLEREAGSVSFSYLLNRASDFEQLTWFCGSPGAKPDCQKP